MSRRTVLAVVVAIGVTTGVRVADAAAPAPAKGLYRGTVSTADGSYRVSLRITTSAPRLHRRAGTITYRLDARSADGGAEEQTPVTCTATLSLRSRKGPTSTYRETHPKGSPCVSGSTVTLRRRDARRLTFRWARPGDDLVPPTRLTR